MRKSNQLVGIPKIKDPEQETAQNSTKQHIYGRKRLHRFSKQ